MIPELQFETLDLRDESTERQFMQTLRAMGVPVSDNRLMVGVNFSVEDEVEDYNEELVKKTVKQQEAKMKTYTILRERNLPIPPDLKAEVESVLMPQQTPPGASPGGLPGAGGPPAPGGPGAPMTGAPGGPGEGIVMPTPPMGLGPGPGGAPVGAGAPPATPQGAMGPGGGSTAPPVSMERRHGLPRPASVNEQAKVADAEQETEAQTDNVSEDEMNAPERLVNKLPRAAKETKKYSIIDEESSEVSDSESSSGKDGPDTEGSQEALREREDSVRVRRNGTPPEDSGE
jgi:hypothetical protein